MTAADEFAAAAAETAAAMAAVRGRIAAALYGSIAHQCARCKVCDHQVDAVMDAIGGEALDRMADLFVAESRFRSMMVRDGQVVLDAEPAREIAAMWLGAVRTLLQGAENYAEIAMEFGPAGTGERYAFTAQRVGKLTPHQARQAAEERAAANGTLLAAVRSALLEGGQSAAAARRNALAILGAATGTDRG